MLVFLQWQKYGKNILVIPDIVTLLPSYLFAPHEINRRNFFTVANIQDISSHATPKKPLVKLD